jgi:uncharacterized protein
MSDTLLAEPATPRLVKSAFGWWVIGARRSYLLGPDAADADGRLRPEAAERMRAAGAYQGKPIVEYSLTVLTATACNLGCGYCFQNTAPDPRGGHRPLRIASVRLTHERAAAVVDFAARQMADVGLDRLHLHLFGGEPLLNPAGCLALLRLAKPRGLSSAAMTSNGTLLTPSLAKELHAAGLGSVQITFDGDRGDHDSTRVRRDGGATFDTILSNMAAASEVTELRWNVRINVSHRNYNGVADLLERIAARLDPPRCVVAFAMVTDFGVGYTNELAPGPDAAAAVVGWNATAASLGFGIRRPVAQPLCSSCSFVPGRFGSVVNADGTLYSCWESAGKPGWEIGTVRDGYVPVEHMVDRWVSCGYDDRSPVAAAAVAEFRDRVDAGVLDFLYRSGRL